MPDETTAKAVKDLVLSLPLADNWLRLAEYDLISGSPKSLIDAMTQVLRATASDVPRLLPLATAYREFERLPRCDPRRLAAEIERLLANPRLGAGWIAFADGEPAGYLLGVYVFSLEHLGLTAEIDELFVAPPQRGRGIGAALIQAAEAEFARAGCTNVSLQMSRDNNQARDFYRRHGYDERDGFELLEKSFADL